MDGRSARRTYTDAEKDAALYLVREVGVAESARRLGISPYTLADWRCRVQAFAHSPYVGRGRQVTDAERASLLAQLVHEQQIEDARDQRKYRHNRENTGAMPRDGLDFRLSISGVVQRHLLEWLDPTFDEVAAQSQRLR